MSAATDVEVLVVGGGPTGLTLALELAEQGVSCRIIDEAPERSDRSRALVVQARSLELLQRHGAVDALLAEGRRAVDAVITVNRRPAAALALGDIGATDSPFPFLLFVSQVETERVLDAALARRGVAVERPWRLASFTQDSAGVQARIEGPDGRVKEVRARYLVGCDGAHSAVRKGLGLRFEGDPYEQEFLLGDVELDGALQPDAVHFFLSQAGLIVAFPFKEPRRYRLIVARASGYADPGDGPPTLETLSAALATMTPSPVALSEPRWLTRFRLHHRGVDRYRVGRAFVAGDAAHIHSPAGGQGMNTGMQDAANLGFKLAHVLRGRAPESFLDSYHAERHPVGQRLLEVTDRLFSFGATANPALIWLRNALAPRLAPWVFRSRARRARAFRFLSQLGIRYRQSPIVGEWLEGADDAFLAAPRAGHRAPDAPLAGTPPTLFERLAGPAHHVLLFAGSGAPRPTPPATLLASLDALAAEAGDWLHCHLVTQTVDGDAHPERWIDPGGAAHARYGAGVGAGVLVRPDGHLAFRSPGTDLAPLRTFLRARYAPAIGLKSN